MFLLPIRRVSNRHLALQFIKLTGSLVQFKYTYRLTWKYRKETRDRLLCRQLPLVSLPFANYKSNGGFSVFLVLRSKQFPMSPK